jgi:hypothetical protein
MPAKRLHSPPPGRDPRPPRLPLARSDSCPHNPCPFCMLNLEHNSIRTRQQNDILSFINSDRADEDPWHRDWMLMTLEWSFYLQSEARRTNDPRFSHVAPTTSASMSSAKLNNPKTLSSVSINNPGVPVPIGDTSAKASSLVPPPFKKARVGDGSLYPREGQSSAASASSAVSCSGFVQPGKLSGKVAVPKQGSSTSVGAVEYILCNDETSLSIFGSRRNLLEHNGQIC